MNSRYRSGILFDPKLLTLFGAITRKIYYEQRKPGSLSEVEVAPTELVAGMIIARDVESGSGVLLMKSGTVLDLCGILIIRSHYRKNPTGHGVFVQVVES